MTDSWYYTKDTQRIGPVAASDIVQKIRDNDIQQDTLVWHEGMTDWKKAGETELSAYFKNPSPSLDTGAKTSDANECVICRKSFSEGELVDVDGHLVCSECKPQMLRRLQEGIGAPDTLRYAGFWIRFFAYFVDNIILKLILVPINFVIGLSATLVSDKGVIVIHSINILVSIIVPMLYSVIFVSKKGATPGKMIFGIRIINSDGTEKISVGKAFGRFFAQILSGLILFIGYLMVAFDERKRGLHDRLCNTFVVYKNKGHE